LVEDEVDKSDMPGDGIGVGTYQINMVRQKGGM